MYRGVTRIYTEYPADDPHVVDNARGKLDCRERDVAEADFQHGQSVAGYCIISHVPKANMRISHQEEYDAINL